MNIVRVSGTKAALQERGRPWIWIGTSKKACAPSGDVAITVNESGPENSGSLSCFPPLRGSGG